MTLNASSSLSFLGVEKQNKKDDHECRLTIVFFKCRETKQKKTMTNADSSLCFQGAKKQNQKNDVLKNKTKKTMMSVDSLSSFLKA
jgi:hypothetical protein